MQSNAMKLPLPNAGKNITERKVLEYGTEFYQMWRLLHPRHQAEKSEYPSWQVGTMRKEYLRLANPVLFSDMVLNETLYEHCAEIEETAKKRMEIIVPQLAKAYGVTEQLKAENQIEWVRQMNACVAQAEEAIKGELIYC